MDLGQKRSKKVVREGWRHQLSGVTAAPALPCAMLCKQAWLIAEFLWEPGTGRQTAHRRAGSPVPERFHQE
eukprot:1160118-Pelagomonas_calceolata.AAC.12